VNTVRSRNRKQPNTQTPEDRALWKEIRERIKKNRADAALQQWAAKGADLAEDCPSLWLVDNAYLLSELQRIRDLVQRVPLASLTMSLPLQSVTDALWSLERQLRDILRIQRDGQRAFAKQVADAPVCDVNITKNQHQKIVRIRA
jgi:hypothetical protein